MIDKTELELKQLAIDLVEGKVFTSNHLCAEGREDMISSIFMPLALGALSGMPEEELKQLGMVYEYLDKAGPIAVNGFPTFMSCGLLTLNDARKMMDFSKEYLAKKSEFLTPVNP
jgi:hypothetical protein